MTYHPNTGQGDLIVFYNNKNALIHVFHRVSHISVVGTTKYPTLCHTRRVKDEAYQRVMAHGTTFSSYVISCD